MALIDEDYVRISLRTEEFRVDFGVIFLLILGVLFGGLLFCLLVTVPTLMVLSLFVHIENNMDVSDFGVLLLIHVLVAVGAAFLAWRSCIRISPEGICLGRHMRAQHATPWTSIQRVNDLRLFGCRFLRIHAESRKPFLLPLNVDRERLMCDLILAHVSPPHPLAAVVQKRLESMR